MKRIPRWMLTLAAIAWSLAFCAALVVTSHAQNLPPAPVELTNPVDEDGIETLTRGPVHEAFAAPTAGDPQPGPVVPKAPPADIDEEPPALQPEGAIWIPGYWEWDDELKDFLWVSGNWRVPPPNLRWVPPYWTEVDGGWQRVPGFWISADAGELDYRPSPPATLEAGPSSPAPADNYFWIPGNWSYYDSGYRWRTGYWSPYQPEWVWMPSRWTWTPAGCVYLPGFWDFRLAFRGQMFAPVYFRRPIYTQPGWCYRPRCVLDSSRLFVHLWIRPSCNSYYFGNYYGSNYTSWNLKPWCQWQTQRGCHDPLLTWCNTHYRRQGVDYVGRVQSWHNHFENHADARPPRTFSEQTRLVASAKLDKSSQSVLARDVRDADIRDNLPLHVLKLDDKAQTAAHDAARNIRQLHTERLKIEHRPELAKTKIELPGVGRPADSDKGRFDLPSAKGNISRGGSDDKPTIDLSKDIKPVGGSDSVIRHESRKLQLPKLADSVRSSAASVKPPEKLDTNAGKNATAETKVKLPSPHAVFNHQVPTSRGTNFSNARSGASNSSGERGSGESSARPSGPQISLPKISQSETKVHSQPKVSIPSQPKISLPSQPNFTPRSSGGDNPSRASHGGGVERSTPKFSIPTRSSGGDGGGSSVKSMNVPKIELPRAASSSGVQRTFSNPRSEPARMSSPSSSSGGIKFNSGSGNSAPRHQSRGESRSSRNK